MPHDLVPSLTPHLFRLSYLFRQMPLMAGTLASGVAHWLSTPPPADDENVRPIQFWIARVPMDGDAPVRIIGAVSRDQAITAMRAESAVLGAATVARDYLAVAAAPSAEAAARALNDWRADGTVQLLDFGGVHCVTRTQWNPDC